MVKNNTDDRIWYKRPVVYGISMLVAIAAYLLLPKSLFHSFRCNSPSTITHTNYQATNGFFVDNQVIVIGPEEDVNRVMGDPEKPGQVGTAGVLLNLAEGCDLSYLNTREFERVALPSPNQTPQITVSAPTQTLQANQTPVVTFSSSSQTLQESNSTDSELSFTPEQRKSLVMRLYEIPHDNDPTEFVINKINQAGGDIVFADPNYTISLLDEGAGLCGQPYAGGGSPYAGGGSPYAGGGSPNAGPGISSIDVRDQFMQQWAFEEDGVNLPSSSKYKGRGVKVGVFDTSPFRKAYFWIPRTIKIAIPESLSLSPRNAMGPDPISNHGLFVSGLIHAIAPKSKIELIRVLNDNGCGNLWEIDTALQDFSSRRSAWTRRLDKVVINLSLGVHIPDPSHVDESQNASGSQHVDWDQIIDELDKIHAYSFEATLSSAHQMGAVIVAAAGNDSAPSLDEPSANALEMQTPASYSDVIGVAATTLNGDRACYSNKGDIAAPGGNGGLETVQKPDGAHLNYCAPRAVTWDLSPEPGSTNIASELFCGDMASCDFGVMSLLIVPDRSGRWKYDYGLWSGTSFSTAFVSGLAALSFERIGSGSPEQVECLIYRKPVPLQPSDRTDDLGVGIINVDVSLTDNTLLSTCRISP